jgi:stearoyl-CoA desaturase (delta-9 desaturase)
MSNQVAASEDTLQERGESSTSKTIGLTHLRGQYRRRALLVNVAPFIGTIVAVVLLPVHPVGLVEFGLLAAMWLVTILGITVGYHRLFTHKSFRTTKSLAVVLAAVAAMAGQGPLIFWVSVHRRHHEHSDEEGDPHSPNLQCAFCQPHLQSALLICQDQAIATTETSDGQGSTARSQA